ncbi:MAG: hypothetical protein LBF68_08160 [Christensenellaceae bacterium]|jgi:DNA-directed RNA polymerase subunit RPC12/RpoP|nr:hypothetical protein [Christensenellaceae bacterium]
MNVIEKKIKKTFRILLGVSVAFPLAIIGTIFGFVNGYIGLGIPSAIILAISFYGMAIGWTFFGIMLSDKNLVNAIVKDGILSMADLAALYRRRPKFMVIRVSELFRKRYLPGYKFNESRTALEKVEKPKEVAVVTSNKCPNCGAELPPQKEGECEYCGSKFHIE